MRISRILMILTFMLLGFLIALSMLPPFMQNMYLHQLILIILLTVFILFSYLPRLSMRTEKQVKTITVVKCTKCSFKMERDFQKGDFVFKRLGTCSCGGELYIDAIYNVEVARTTTRRK